jgi:hypothetical protein
MTGWRALLTAGVIAVAYINQAQAQTTDSVTAPPSRHSAVLRASKWTTLGFTLGAAAYGFATNRTADRNYTALEEDCTADRVNCTQRTSSGAFADAGLERRYQDVRALDRRARTALLASQVGLAATVVLFVIDLRDNRPPKDIPYTPRAVQLLPRSDGGLQLRFTLPLPIDQR